MTYRTDDEKKFLTDFLQWIHDHIAPEELYAPGHQGALVDAYLKYRERQRAWSK